MAKSASGALELIPYIQITNLADALANCTSSASDSIGLDSDGPAPLDRHVFRRQDRPGARRRGQGIATEDARDRQRAGAARHAGRDQVAERLESPHAAIAMYAGASSLEPSRFLQVQIASAARDTPAEVPAKTETSATIKSAGTLFISRL
jgi:23S rRNA (guanosine2251-2'-O)-methyltransferase